MMNSKNLVEVLANKDRMIEYQNGHYSASTIKRIMNQKYTMVHYPVYEKDEDTFNVLIEHASLSKILLEAYSLCYDALTDIKGRQPRALDKQSNIVSFMHRAVIIAEGTKVWLDLHTFVDVQRTYHKNLWLYEVMNDELDELNNLFPLEK